MVRKITHPMIPVYPQSSQYAFRRSSRSDLSTEDRRNTLRKQEMQVAHLGHLGAEFSAQVRKTCCTHGLLDHRD